MRDLGRNARFETVHDVTSRMSHLHVDLAGVCTVCIAATAARASGGCSGGVLEACRCPRHLRCGSGSVPIETVGR